MWKHYQVKKDRPKMCNNNHPLLWHLNQDTKGWQTTSRYMYWYYKLTNEKEVQVDVYHQVIPWR